MLNSNSPKSLCDSLQMKIAAVILDSQEFQWVLSTSCKVKRSRQLKPPTLLCPSVCTPLHLFIVFI